MVKGGKVSSKKNFKRRVQSKYRESDDSDEDYVISDEGSEVSEELEEDYCSSVDGDASEESFGSFVEEEEEEEEVKKVIKNSRSRAKKGSDSLIVEEEEEDDDEEMKQVRKAVGSTVQNGFPGRPKNGVKPSRKRRKVTYQEMEDEDDDDEEFTPDEDEFSEVEEKPVVERKKTNVKVGKRRLRKKGPVRGEKRRKSMASKKPVRKKGRKNGAVKRKVICDDDRSSNGALWHGLTGMNNSISVHGQLHHFSSGPNMGSEGGVFPNTAIEQIDFHTAKDQLKVMVKSQLDKLSRDIDLETTEALCIGLHLAISSC